MTGQGLVPPQYYRFPDPEEADPNGVLCYGGDLSIETLWEAYHRGIFPWPHEGVEDLLWFSPLERGVLFLDQLHLSRSFQRYLRKPSPYHFTMNTTFEEVIRFCAFVPRKGQSGSWITEEMIRAYTRFHEQNYALSIECWSGERLVGGIYGVLVSGVFSAESMFGLEPNVSKICLWNAALFCRSIGLKWMDVQMVTPITSQFGARLVPRLTYLKLLEQAHVAASQSGEWSVQSF